MELIFAILQKIGKFNSAKTCKIEIAAKINSAKLHIFKKPILNKFVKVIYKTKNLENTHAAKISSAKLPKISLPSKISSAELQELGYPRR